MITKIKTIIPIVALAAFFSILKNFTARGF